MLNIVVPMAGAGSRFAQAGFADPKPLIQVHGRPMIQLVIENLQPRQAHRFIFICQRAHVKQFGLRSRLEQWAPGCQIVEIDGVTEGAAVTVLKAEALIDSEEPLMIANSDQYVDVDINAYLSWMQEGVDGLIMTMTAADPKWSFVGLSPAGLVTRVVEKQVISNEATVGIYNFSHGKEFVKAARAMIARNERVNNEFYVAPVYNELIRAGHRIAIRNVGSDGHGMHGLGTPKDLEAFLALPISRQSAGTP